MNKNKINSLVLLDIFKDSLLYIPSKLIPSLFGFLSLYAYTRLFTPAEYGIYSIIVSITGFIGIFSFSWINYSNLRFFYQYRKLDDLKTLLSTSFCTLIACITASCLIIAYLSKINLLPNDFIAYLSISIGVLITSSFFEVTMNLLISERKPKDISLFRCLSSISYLTISLIIIYFFNRDISSILIAYVITNTCLTALVIKKYNLYMYIRIKYFSERTFREITNYGIPLITLLMFYWSLTLSNRYIIEYFKGSEEVGIYSAMYQLGDYPISLLSSIVFTAAFPIVVNAWEKSKKSIVQELMSDLIRYYLFLAIPLLIGVVLLSNELASMLGPEYFAGSSILPWICFGSLVFGLCGYINTGFELLKKTRILSKIIILIIIFNIIINILIVPIYGSYGCGIATSISYTLYLTIAGAISMRLIPFTISIRSIMRILTCSLIMGGAIIVIKDAFTQSLTNLLLLILIGIIIYLIASWFLGETKTEVDFLLKYLNSKEKL